jgi:hypothetical protein
MHVAQSGIFALGTGSHSYLEFDLHVSSIAWPACLIVWREQRMVFAMP